MAERTFRYGARAVVPLAVAVVGFGISFGVIARAIAVRMACADRDVGDRRSPFGPSSPPCPCSLTAGRSPLRSRRRSCGNASTHRSASRSRRNLTGSLVEFRPRAARRRRVLAIAAEGEGRFSRSICSAPASLYVSWVAARRWARRGAGIGDPAAFGSTRRSPPFPGAPRPPPSRSAARRGGRPRCCDRPRAHAVSRRPRADHRATPRVCWG